jgi:hypothetical protein
LFQPGPGWVALSCDYLESRYDHLDHIENFDHLNDDIRQSRRTDGFDIQQPDHVEHPEIDHYYEYRDHGQRDHHHRYDGSERLDRLDLQAGLASGLAPSA